MNSTNERQWCVAAALKTELAAVRALRLRNVILLETGVGPANAERTVRKACENNDIGGIIQIGFAGALSRSLLLTDVVVADKIEGDGTASNLISAVKRLQKAVPSGVRTHQGTFITVNRILATAEEKRALADEHSADEVACVDMESAPVCGICAERAIPYVGLRAITDVLDEDLPVDLNECLGRDGNFDTMRVMWSAVHHPSTISGLLELRRRARDCAQALARCVHAIVSANPSPTSLSKDFS